MIPGTGIPNGRVVETPPDFDPFGQEPTMNQRGEMPAKVWSLPKSRTLGQMVNQPRPMKRAVVNGLVRLAEVCQITCPPKTMKTWLAIDYGLSVAFGTDFLGVFPTTQGRVLHIDTELDEGNFDFRFNEVMRARGHSIVEANKQIESICLRGKGGNFYELCDAVESDFSEGEFSLIIIDAIYKLYPKGFSENDNADATAMMNRFTELGSRMNAGVTCIHHASKGNQSQKAVTDVGSGAGAMARAADSYLILREHELKGCSVLEGRTRSFLQPEPTTLKFDFPVWHVKADIAPEVKQKANASKIAKEIERRADVAKIQNEYADGSEFSPSDIKKLIGCGMDKANGIVAFGIDAGSFEKGRKFKRPRGKDKTQHYKLTGTPTGLVTGTDP